MSATVGVVFPFDLPSPTGWYAALSVTTLLLHALFMSYVLGGTLMLGVAGLRGMLGREAPASAWRPVTAVLKDWMPFALSAAITAGVGPLLFVQILYQREFYTANLLAFHRWMSILPVLIVAFYLLYLLKAHRLERRASARGAVALVVAACVLFVAWSWVENHLLSLNSAVWAEQYASGAMFYESSAVPARLAFWVAAALFTAPALLAWQLRAGASGVGAAEADGAARAMGWLALVAGAACAAGAWLVLGRSAPGAALWLGVSTAGFALSAAGWAAVVAQRRLAGLGLTAATAGCVVFWAGALLAREAARWVVTGTAENIARHERVGTSSGLVVFVAFALLGVLAVGWIVREVARAVGRVGR